MKTLEEMTDEEIREAAREIIGDCELCGRKAEIRRSDYDPKDSRNQLNPWPEWAKTLQDIYRSTVETRESLLKIDPDMAERFLHTPTRCNACIEQARISTAAETQKRRVETLRRKLKSAGLFPDEAQAENFETSDPTYEARNPETFKRFRAIAGEKLPSSYWFTGKPGSGKTYLAHAILNARADRCVRVARISAIEVCQIGDAWDRGKKLHPYIQVPLLLIDDMDKPVWNERGLEAMWQVFDGRHREKNRTLITSNLFPREIRDRMDASKGVNPSHISSMFDRMLPMKEIKMEWEGESARRGD